MELDLQGYYTGVFKLGLWATIILLLIYIFLYSRSYDDGLPIVNRRFRLEPRLFARIRWAFNSRDILKAANEKVDSIGCDKIRKLLTKISMEAVLIALFEGMST